MNPTEISSLEIASNEVVQQAARDFAAALAATPQFQSFEAAAETMEHDTAAQEALHTFQAKQQELKMAQTLKTITLQEQNEFEQLRQAFLTQPSVVAFYQAQASLVAICQAAGDILSDSTGLNFAASACSSGCC